MHTSAATPEDAPGNNVAADHLAARGRSGSSSAVALGVLYSPSLRILSVPRPYISSDSLPFDGSLPARDVFLRIATVSSVD